MFAGDAKFLNSIQEGVSFLSSIRRDLGGLVTDAAIPPAHTTAWEQLKQNARTDKLSRKEHLAAILDKRGGGFREWVAGIMLALSAVWLVVLWVWTGSPINTLLQPISKSEHLAPATAHFAPYPYPKQDIAKPMAKEQRSAPAPAAEIAWSNQKSPQREECNLALAAVLIENNAENRRYRDRVCAGDY